ncbi:hypothetical protein AWC38_SpisGene14024 [Stylophora pistillata]|uniref:Uncharacterized protein n=1 Tax=Stylophora pistillata TaxID=50429 RepID=A0A2B4RYT4_STYPI|nr:hypothetical protein AWC38_SpisGene14024 [Stylophora pistillata]
MSDQDLIARTTSILRNALTELEGTLSSNRTNKNIGDLHGASVCTSAIRDRERASDNFRFTEHIEGFCVNVKSSERNPKSRYRARMQKERRDSGVEVEETELDRALEEINEKWEAAEEQDISWLNNKKKSTEEDRAMGEEVRKKACEKLSEAMKRKGEGEGSSQPTKKRSRKGGNEKIGFLKEKANIDMAMKQEEQKARREEHERQTRLYELALANQQQQQQQSSQLMSLIFGLMQQIARRKDS